MNDVIFLMVAVTALTTVLTEWKEGIAQLLLCAVTWWSLGFTIVLVLTDYWFIFLIPFVIGWLYLLRVVTQILDSNKLKELVVRAYG
jgi:hypothetical protein